MRRITGISATTHIDSQGDKLSVGALVKHAEAGNAAYYPFGLNHDPRIAPIGRVIKERVVLIQGGQAAIEFEAEIFDPGDLVEFNGTGKRVPPNILLGERALVFDRTYGPAEVLVIERLARDLGLRPVRRSKKAAIPLAFLLFCTGAVAGGFLDELGKDLYKFGKQQVKQLNTLMKGRRRETVLVFQFEISRDGRPVQVEIFATNPKGIDIQRFLDMKVQTIEESLEPLLSCAETVKVVGEYRNRRIFPKFLVRADGVPFDASGSLVAHEGNLPSGISISFQDEELEK